MAKQHRWVELSGSGWTKLDASRRRSDSTPCCSECGVDFMVARKGEPCPGKLPSHPSHSWYQRAAAPHAITCKHCGCTDRSKQAALMCPQGDYSAIDARVLAAGLDKSHDWHWPGRAPAMIDTDALRCRNCAVGPGGRDAVAARSPCPCLSPAGESGKSHVVKEKEAAFKAAHTPAVHELKMSDADFARFMSSKRIR